MAGNNALNVAFLVSLGRNKIGIALVGSLAGAVLTLGLLVWMYLSFGWSGPLFIAGLVFAAICADLLRRDRRRQHRRATDAEEAARLDAWLSQWPAEARTTVHRLYDRQEAAVLWSAIGMGRLPDRARYGPDDRGDAPILLDVRRSPAGVEIDLAPQHGMTANEFKRAGTAQLAWALSAPEVHLVAVDPQRRVVTLDMRYYDPVAQPVRAPQPEEPVDLYSVAIGTRANGEPWRVPIAERNLLVAGVMGSGKSGVMRALILALAPAIRDGLVRVAAIDLKFGIEVRQMRGLIHEVATTPPDAKKMLQRMLAQVKDRGEWMEAHGYDKHVATPDNPLWLLIIDELAELLDDPDMRNEILSLMRHIMRPGRALGFSIGGFTQAPEKENIASVRNLFQIRVGLRLTEESMLNMIYGGQAKERGAGNVELADEGTQGIAFVASEGGRDIERVRAHLVPKEMFEAAAAIYPPYRHPHLEPAPKRPPGQLDSNQSATSPAPVETADDAAPRKKPVPGFRLPPTGGAPILPNVPQVGRQDGTVIPFDRSRSDRPEATPPTGTTPPDGDTGTE